MCGEQLLENQKPLRNGGSPPRVRGTELQNINGLERQRITPACAGNSAILRSNAASLRDHPRVCGEQ